MLKKTNFFITSQNRPYHKIFPRYLTIHNTANSSSGANAMANRNYFQNHTEAKASCHWIVDDKQAILCIPEDEMAWHTGTTKGNLTSIGIEVCENRDANQAKIYANAVELAADILQRYGWGLDRLKKHQDWSGKYCPHKLIPVWDKFKEDIAKALKNKKTSLTK